MGFFTNDCTKEMQYGIKVAEKDWTTVAEIIRTEYKKNDLSVHTDRRPDGNGGTIATVTLGFRSTLNEYSDIIGLCGERGIKRVKHETTAK